MGQFYNPYHFVPVEAPRPTELGTPGQILRESRTHITHDRYAPGAHSGRVICSIRSVTPFVLGAARFSSAAEFSIVQPALDEDGRPYVPASSLLGMCGSILEAASSSALRVLQQRSLSYRVGVDDPDGLPLSALGLIVQTNRGLRLRPLALPTLVARRADTDFRIPGEYATAFGLTDSAIAPLKTYVGSSDDIRSPSLFAQRNGIPLQTEPNVFGLVPQVRVLREPDGTFWLPRQAELYIKNNRFLIGLRPPAEASWLTLTSRAGAIPGILRVLGPEEDRNTVLPSTKKHELFVPLPGGANRPLLEIPPAVLDRFHQLADERTAEDRSLPYNLLGYPRNDDEEASDNLRIQEGDIVYFRPDDSGRQVAELSFSAVWRRAPKGGVHSFFRAISPNTLPWGSEGRTGLTPAEQMLGVVPLGKHEKFALAKRVRFSRARLADQLASDNESALFHPWTLLRILGNPKPPCPEFYFRSRQNPAAFFKASQLAPGEHLPMGRKAYLHQRADEQWRSKWPDSLYNLKQKAIVRPVRPEVQFWFHVDFDNLSDQELELLCYSLAPSDDFHHKLGMGKPLGLGSVRLQPAALLLVDRTKRYSSIAALVAPRYSRSAGALELAQIPKRYRAQIAGAVESDVLAFGSRRDAGRSRVPSAVHCALEKLGRLDLAGDNKVHYPTADANQLEREAFQWFVKNRDEKSGRKERIGVSPRTFDVQGKTPAPLSERAVFFLGGRDLEMLAIRELIQVSGHGRFVDHQPTWGASVADYAAEFASLAEDEIPVLIELGRRENDHLPPRAIVIDHHNQWSGQGRPSSLEQVFALLGLKYEEWTRELALIAANDRGYIEEMLAIGATPEEIRSIRERDRRAQGVTANHENAAQSAARAARGECGGKLTIVELPHVHAATAADCLHAALGGPGFENLLVRCRPADGATEQVTFSGAGRLVNQLKGRFPGGWFGGALPARGYWGSKTAGWDAVLAAVRELLA